MSKYSSPKYYQDSKERLQRKVHKMSKSWEYKSAFIPSYENFFYSFDKTFQLHPASIG